MITIKKFITLSILAFLCFMINGNPVLAQNTEMKGSKQLRDASRYNDYSGRPFYFKKNQKAKLYITDVEEPYELLSANYNLITNNLEFYEGKYFTEINGKRIDKILFEVDGEVIEINKNRALPNGFMVKLYESDRFRLLENVSTRVEERMYNTPGKNLVKKLIRKDTDYVLNVDGVPNTVELNKKEISFILGKEAEKAMKATKNKLKNHWDLVRLLKTLDEKV